MAFELPLDALSRFRTLFQRFRSKWYYMLKQNNLILWTDQYNNQIEERRDKLSIVIILLSTFRLRQFSDIELKCEPLKYEYHVPLASKWLFYNSWGAEFPFSLL